jgi:DNA-binding NarL/FixJ family response regulator
MAKRGAHKGLSEARITERELAIVRLIARGLVNKQIADELGIKPATVASRLHNLYGRFDVQTRAALVHKLGPML